MRGAVCTQTYDWIEEGVRLNMEGGMPVAQNCDNFWKVPNQKVKHDPRGTPFYVKNFVEDAVANDETLHWPHPNIAVANQTKRKEDRCEWVSGYEEQH